MKLAALAVLLVSAPAVAQPTVELVPTCVEIDAAHDDLPEAERPAARLLLVRALERLDQLIVVTGCRDTIVLSHVVAGERVQVRLANAREQRRLTVSVRGDMLEVYGRIARSLLEPQVADSAFDDASARPVQDYTAASIETTAAYEPVPLKAGTWYALFGLGIHDGAAGKGFAFGYRYGGRWKLDLGVSFAGGDSSTTALRAQLLKLRTPNDRSSVYYGMGVSLASTELQMSSGASNGGGARIESTLGIELGRTSRKRLYLESNLSVPLYLAGERYPIALVTSFGAGF